MVAIPHGNNLIDGLSNEVKLQIHGRLQHYYTDNLNTVEEWTDIVKDKLTNIYGSQARLAISRLNCCNAVQHISLWYQTQPQVALFLLFFLGVL